MINSILLGGDDAEGGRTSSTSAESSRRCTEGERGIVGNAVETPISRAGTSASSANDVTRWTVKRDEWQAGHQWGYKYYVNTVLISVFKLTLRMKICVQIPITACILSMVSSVLTLMIKEKRPSSTKPSCLIVEYLERSKCFVSYLPLHNVLWYSHDLMMSDDMYLNSHFDPLVTVFTPFY